MHSKNYRTNHDFQNAYFLAGKCHTPDAAYATLCDQRDSRVDAVANYHVQQKRTAAKRMRLEDERSRELHQARILEIEADLEEINNGEKAGHVCYAAALDELAFLERCIEAVQPLRKYKHLPDPEAHEAAQREEWLLELIERAEDMYFCHGTLSPDHLTTMRAHPDFLQVIAPALMSMQDAVQKGNRFALVQKRPCAGDFLPAIESAVIPALPAPKAE